MSLNKFIEIINKPLEKLVKGIKVYGLAEAVTIKTGSDTKTIPGIVANDGEIKEVSPDDLQSVIIYHKAVGLVSRPSTKIKGYGSDPNATDNLYTIAMIVWLDRKKTNLRPDELFLYIQANFPIRLQIEPYVYVAFQINNAILNGQQVYDSEFKGVVNKLPSNQTLMQINYTIESTFKIKCFEKCPEEC